MSTVCEHSIQCIRIISPAGEYASVENLANPSLNRNASSGLKEVTSTCII
jgi:hypothetical protein